MRPWDSLVPDEDLRVVNAAGYGTRMEWGIHPALVVIDATRSFLGERGVVLDDLIRTWPNACGPHAWTAVDMLADLLTSARENSVPIFYTVGGFRDDGWNLGSWRWKQPRSREDASASREEVGGNEIVDPLRPAHEDVVIPKLKPSGFFETPLRSLLQLLGVDTLVVAGGTTSGCVRGTVLDAFSHNLKVIVPEECCFDRLQVSHGISLFDMNAKYADVVPAPEVARYFEELAENPLQGRRLLKILK